MFPSKSVVDVLYVSWFQETLSTYPTSFATPILFLVHKLSCRGRIDDLVNDIYFFVKDHYLLGEEVTLSGGRGKRRVKILKVTYNDVENDEDASQYNDVKKPAILYMFLVLQFCIIVKLTKCYTQNRVFMDFSLCFPFS